MHESVASARPVRPINSRNGKELADTLSFADTAWKRFKGLIGKNSLSCNEALWIKPCKAVHTFGMKFPVDLVFLNKQNVVISTLEIVQPNRLPPILLVPYSVLEVAAGRIAETETRPGDLITMVGAYDAPTAPSGQSVAARPPSPVMGMNRSRYQELIRYMRQFLWPMACSVCLHLLMVAALAAEWQSRPQLVWVDLLETEPAQVAPVIPDLSDVKPPANEAGDAEVPALPEEADEQHRGLSNEAGQPDASSPPKPAVATDPAITATPTKIPANTIASQDPPALSDVTGTMLFSRYSTASLPGSPPHMMTVSELEPLQLPPLPIPAQPLQNLPHAGEALATKKGRQEVMQTLKKPPAIHHALMGSKAEAAKVHKAAAVAAEILPKASPSESEHTADTRPAVATVREPPVPLARNGADTTLSDAREIPKSSQKVSPPEEESRPASREGTSTAVTIQPNPGQQHTESTPSDASARANPPLEKLEEPTTMTLRQVVPVFDARAKGDLELYLTSSETTANGIKITVLFRAYPRNRHKTAMSIRESKKVKMLSPKISRTGINAVQAVIDIASDGIYEFRGATEAGPGEASCTVTIYGTSSRPTIKQLGNKKISNDSYILKVLMPEGILWDEEANFSGSIKDSEGIIKFNSETGMTWKEYD